MLILVLTLLVFFFLGDYYVQATIMIQIPIFGGQCCEVVLRQEQEDSTDAISACVMSVLTAISTKSTSKATLSNSLNIALVSYSTPSISNYARYSMAINAAFAENSGYSIALYNPATGSNYEPRDQRWNRVKLLLEILSSQMDNNNNNGYDYTNNIYSYYHF